MQKRLISFFLLFFIFLGCTDDSIIPRNNPKVFLSHKSGFASGNVSLRFNDKVTVEVNCTFNGFETLSKLEVIRKTTDTFEIVDEMSINEDYYTYHRVLAKSYDKIEKYVFVVTDAGGLSGTDSIKLVLNN